MGDEPQVEPLDALRAFLRAELPEGWAADVERGDLDAAKARRRDVDGPAFVRRLGAAGWVVPNWEPRYGGRGLDVPTARAVLDELELWGVPRLPIGSGVQLAAPAIHEWASEDTKLRLLPRIATGEEAWCQLFSEPGAGSDLASLACTAVRDGDEWVVNGQKVWTTYAHASNFAMLLARTDPDQPKHKGITYFGLDLRQPGVEVRTLVNLAGEHEFNEVFLTDARIPDLYRISPVGEGWGAALTTLSAERFTLSGTRKKGKKAGDAILGGRTLDQVLALAAEVGAGSSRVRRDELARAYSREQVLRWTIARAKADGALGSMLKVLKAETNQALQLLAASLLGADAQAWSAADAEGREATVVRELLRTRANSIEGGTSEIQRNIVAERVLGLPKEPDPYKGAAWRQVPR